MAASNMEAFEYLPIDALVVNAAGCGSTLKEYGELLIRAIDWRKRSVTFTSFLWRWDCEPREAESIGRSRSRNPAIWFMHSAF